MLAVCDSCGSRWDTHDGGGRCSRCGSPFCPECLELYCRTSNDEELNVCYECLAEMHDGLLLEESTKTEIELLDRVMSAYNRPRAIRFGK